MKHNILITAPCHEILREGLSMMSMKVLYAPSMNAADLIKHISEFEGIIIATKIPITKTLLDKATKLQWIGRLGSGIDHIEISAVKERNIQVITSPEGNAPSVGEHALGMLLNTIRNIQKSHMEIKKNIWDRDDNRGNTLHERKVGIIGFGHTGKAFAQRLNALGCKVWVYDKFIPIQATEVIQPSSLSDLQKSCDVISLHIDYTKDNHHFVDTAFFQQLNQQPIFINTSRGSCVDTQALLLALQNKKLSYACLDVLENEYISSLSESEQKIFNQLIHHPNVLLTCHIAGVTQESFYQMSKILLDKLAAYYQKAEE